MDCSVEEMPTGCLRSLESYISLQVIPHFPQPFIMFGSTCCLMKREGVPLRFWLSKENQETGMNEISQFDAHENYL